MEYQDEMCEKLIKLSFAKIVSGKNERGSCLRKNLLIFQLLQRARTEQQRVRSQRRLLCAEQSFSGYAQLSSGGDDIAERYAMLDVNESILQWNESSSVSTGAQQTCFTDHHQRSEMRMDLVSAANSDNYFYYNDADDDVGKKYIASSCLCQRHGTRQTQWPSYACCDGRLLPENNGKTMKRRSGGGGGGDDDAATDQIDLLPEYKKLCLPKTSSDQTDTIDGPFSYFSSESTAESSGRDFAPFLELICES